MEWITQYFTCCSMCNDFVRIIQIKTYGICCFVVGVLLISFPAMTSLFAYMFTAPYYMFAVLLMISAVYMTVKYSYGFLPAIIMMGFSMGIYQTYFGVGNDTFCFDTSKVMQKQGIL